MLKRGALPPMGGTLREVQRITPQEKRLRRETIAVLKQELAKHLPASGRGMSRR